MRVFLFGAGSSFGTLEHHKARPPLAKDFGVFLSKQHGFPWKYPNLALAAGHVGKDLSQTGLEELWTCIDYYAKLSGPDRVLPTPDWLWPAVRELKVREVQVYYTTPEVFQVIMHQWQGVVDAVRDADELVVVGYSFPKEDQYGRFLFQEGMRLRGTRPIRRIEYYNTIAESGASILEVFGGKGTETAWQGPVLAAS